MRRNRRGRSEREFGGSGEDSFVAVVVTKLTGALLFILLLTMVIMALLPKAMDTAARKDDATAKAPKLEIRTSGTLPEAIAGRPYRLALSAAGGGGPLRWSIDGKLPDGVTLDPETGILQGTPKEGTPEPLLLVVRASDGTKSATAAASWVVYRPDAPLGVPSRWDLKLPALPWASWLRQGFGFVVLWLVYVVGQNSLGGLARRAVSKTDDESARAAALRRHGLYRNVVRAAGASAFAVLGAWLWMHRGA